MTDLPQATESRLTSHSLPQRRSNPERSATTRAKVIGAAIKCLSELGYEGTTVILVAKRAGVSRGAAQHQFPSKVDLMVAVAAGVIEDQASVRKRLWDTIPNQKGRVSHVVEASWNIQKQPENVALFEILMATRNDNELRQRFAPFAKQIADLRLWSAQCIAGLAGIEATPELEALARLHFAAMRGISLDCLLDKDESSARATINLLIRCLRMMLDEIIGNATDTCVSEQPVGSPETIA